MKVKDLIKHLEKFPENMEVVFYNGFVDDVQPISNTFIQENLKKHSLLYYKNGFMYDFYNKHDRNYNIEPSDEEMRNIEKRADEMYKSPNNEYVKYYNNIDELDTKDWFDKKIKKRLLLQAKITNKTYFDRCGSISY